MANYRPVKTSFWDDEYVLELKPDEKLMYLFLITNSNTKLCGIYKLSIGYAYRMTSISKSRVVEIIQKFIRDHKINYVQDWVYVKNCAKHQSASPTIKIGIERELKEIPLEIKETLYGMDTISVGIDKPILKLELELKPDSKESCYMCMEDFEEFWKVYPKKKARKNAEKKFLTLTHELLPKIIAAIEKQRSSFDWQKEKGKYIPFPSTWLNGERWKDEEVESTQTFYPTGQKIISSLSKEEYERSQQQN